MKKVKILCSLLAVLTMAFAGSLLTGHTVAAIAERASIAVPVALTVFTVVLAFNFKMKAQIAMSAPAPFTKGLCEKVQTSVVNLMKNNAPEVKRTPVGYLQAIMSPANRAGFSAIPVDQGNGKKRTVRATYAQRGTEADITDTYNNGCTPEISKVPFETDIEVNTPLSTLGISFSEDEMRKLCEDDDVWMARVVNAELNPFMTALNKRLIALQAANFGNFSGGSNVVKSRKLINSATNSADYYGENLILNDFEDIDATGRPILIGSGKLRDYTRLTDIGCCNNLGTDLGQAGDFDFFQDRMVGGILGNVDDFIGLAPGNVQLVTYNKYVGKYKKENDVFSKGTFIDPYTGIKLDMRWKYDDCNEVYTLTFGLWYELFFLPDDAFAAGDELNGVNYSLHYRATAA